MKELNLNQIDKALERINGYSDEKEEIYSLLELGYISEANDAFDFLLVLLSVKEEVL